jgi:hypothetical protein
LVVRSKEESIRVSSPRSRNTSPLPKSSWPTRSESGRRARGGARRAHACPRRASPQHAEHGLCDAVAALEAGATLFDTSCGGVGGCPYAPRATENIATEDLAYPLEGDGIETGIDLDALTAVSHWLEGLLGRRLEGQVYRAGAGA